LSEACCAVSARLPGDVVDYIRIDSDPVALACAIEQADADPEVVLRAARATPPDPMASTAERQVNERPAGGWEFPGRMVRELRSKLREFR